MFGGKLSINSKAVVFGMELLGLQTEKPFQAVKLIEMEIINIHLDMDKNNK